TVPLRQLGLVIEQLHVARTAGHEEKDDVLRLRLEMGVLGRKWIDGTRRGETVLLEQRTERDGAETDAALLEEPAAVDGSWALTTMKMVLAVHGFGNWLTFPS